MPAADSAAPETAPSVSATVSLPEASSTGPLIITPANLSTYAGQPNYLTDKLYEVNPIGVSTGLAYSSDGGAVLFIESAIADVTSRAAQLREAMAGQQSAEERDSRDQDDHVDQDEDEDDDHSRANPAHMDSPSRGDLFCTGQLGSVMRESSSIAYTIESR